MTPIAPKVSPWLIAATLTGCAGKTAGLDFGDASAFETPPGDAVPYDDAFGPLIPVSGGYAVFGQWRLQEGRLSPFPYGCNRTKPAESSGRALVAPFRLMQREVSNADYGICVATGSCAAPDADLSLDPDVRQWNDDAKRNKPVAAGYFAAKRFCRHYGGDLPTIGQWTRAGAGDSSDFGVAGVSARYVTCRADPSASPECAAILAASFRDRTPGHTGPPYRTLPDVATTGWDKGAFGHLDMFGGAAEWTRALFRSLDAQYCPDGPLDSTLYASPESIRPVDRLGAFQVADVIYNGFRCAFPN